MKSAALSRQDVAVLMASTVRRYRRGEITEKTANRENALLKALVDGMGRAEGPEALTPAEVERRMETVEERIIELVLKSPGFREKMRAALKEAKR